MSVVSVPAMRQAALGFLTKTYDTHTEIYPNTDERESEIKDDRFQINFDKEYSVTYLPKGFKILTSTRFSSGHIADYYDENDCFITFQQTVAEDTSMDIDTEGAIVENIDINGYGAMLGVEKENNEITVTWQTEAYIINITGVGVSEEEIIKVAQSVK